MYGPHPCFHLHRTFFHPRWVHQFAWHWSQSSGVKLLAPVRKLFDLLFRHGILPREWRQPFHLGPHLRIRQVNDALRMPPDVLRGLGLLRESLIAWRNAKSSARRAHAITNWEATAAIGSSASASAWIRFAGRAASSPASTSRFFCRLALIESCVPTDPPYCLGLHR